MSDGLESHSCEPREDERVNGLAIDRKTRAPALRFDLSLELGKKPLIKPILINRKCKGVNLCDLLRFALPQLLIAPAACLKLEEIHVCPHSSIQ